MKCLRDEKKFRGKKLPLYKMFHMGIRVTYINKWDGKNLIITKIIT